MRFPRPRVPAWLRAPGTLLLRFRWLGPSLSILGVVGLVAATVVLVTPGFFARPAALSAEDVGTPARKDYRASRDFTYTELDPVATRARREEAARGVLSVYDFDLEERDRIVQQLRESFAWMRSLFDDRAERRRQIEQAAAPGPPEVGPPRPRPEPARPRGAAGREEAAGGPEAGRAAQRGELEALQRWFDTELEDRRREFYRRLHQTLASDEYGFLAAQGFSKETEGHLVYLTSGVMQKKVLATSGAFKYHREQGIRLRVVRGVTPVDEIEIKDDFSEFLTVQEAVERLAVMARRGLKELDPEARDRLVDIAGRLIVANCRYDRIETESRRAQAKEAVPSLAITRDFRKGQIVVDRHHIITEQHVAIVRADLKDAEETDLVLAAVGNALLVLLIGITLLRFFRRYVRKFSSRPKDLAFLGLWIVGNLALFRFSMSITAAMAESWRIAPAEVYLYVLPVAAVPMLVRMVLNSETAVASLILSSALVGMVVDWNLPFVLFTVVGGLTAASGVGRAKQRTDLLNAGLRTGLANALFVLGLVAAQGSLDSIETLVHALLAGLGGILAGLAVTAVLPVAESLFDYTTNIKLLELANLNNPLLKELAIRAPGTFHHSILVGNLVEAAAESIRANPLLARVGAYYHDVGKIKAPHYFAENQRPGNNPHDRLAPSMSALVLKEHVREGVKMLQSKGYPRILADICEQHVGTSLIAYFYHRAKTQAEERQEPLPLETDYRYPGPKPQTREAALVFLGDSVEAAAKSMQDPSPARLQGMVQNLVNARFIDGQLSECDLTLSDLHRIARAFIRGLSGIYHSRPEYPGDRRKREDTGNHRRSGATQTGTQPTAAPRTRQVPTGAPVTSELPFATVELAPSVSGAASAPQPSAPGAAGGPGSQADLPAFDPECSVAPLGTLGASAAALALGAASAAVPAAAAAAGASEAGPESETAEQGDSDASETDETEDGGGAPRGGRVRGGRGSDPRAPHAEAPSLRRLGSMPVE